MEQEINKVFIVTSGTRYIGCFTNENDANHFCEVRNQSLDDFLLPDEEFVYFADKADKLAIDKNVSIKMYWDYQVDIDPNTKKYGEITYIGTGKELTRTDKIKDVEQYAGAIFCRSYESKEHAEKLCRDAWQAYQQEVLVGA